MCVRALARLHYYSEGVVAKALKAYMASADQYKPQEACNIMWALAQQRHHPLVSFAL